MHTRILALFTALVVTATACSPAAPAPTQSGSTTGSTTAERRAPDQTLRISKGGLPGSASPESAANNLDIWAAVFDSLVTFGPNFEIRPAAAEKWEFRPADSAWRFSLRKDLVFSNGDKMTADDVVYSANQIVEKTLPVKNYLPLLAGAKKVDDYTVDIVSKVPDVTMLNGGPWLHVFPAKYHQEVGPAQFGLKPIGTGPYELVEYKAADRMVYRLRSTAHPFRKPIPTELRFIAVPELGQQVNGLRTGEIDIAPTNFTGDQADQLKSAGLVVNSAIIGTVSALYSQPEMELRNSPLKDKRVRIALNYAVNAEALAKAIYKGYAKPVGQLGVPGSPFWDTSAQPYPYDPAMAKKLLAEAGYPNGFKLPLGIEYTPSTANPDLMIALQNSLKEVGIEAALTPYELATFLDKYYGRPGHQKGDLFITSQGDSTGVFAQGRGIFDCAKKDFQVWWCSTEFNRLYDQAIQEPDATKRSDMMKRANAAFRSEVPLLFLVAYEGFLVHNAKLKGVEWTTLAVFTYDKVYRVE